MFLALCQAASNEARNSGFAGSECSRAPGAWTNSEWTDAWTQIEVGNLLLNICSELELWIATISYGILIFASTYYYINYLQWSALSIM